MIQVQSLVKEVGLERRQVLQWFKDFEALPERSENPPSTEQHFKGPAQEQGSNEITGLCKLFFCHCPAFLSCVVQTCEDGGDALCCTDSQAGVAVFELTHEMEADIYFLFLVLGLHSV